MTIGRKFKNLITAISLVAAFTTVNIAAEKSEIDEFHEIRKFLSNHFPEMEKSGNVLKSVENMKKQDDENQMLIDKTREVLGLTPTADILSAIKNECRKK